MVSKDLQNSRILTWERNFEVMFGIFPVLVVPISVLESYLDICFKISYDQKCENCDNLGLLIKVLPIFRLYQKILHRFVSFCISLIFTYCLFVEKKLVMMKQRQTCSIETLQVHLKFYKICKFESHVTRNDIIMMALPKTLENNGKMCPSAEPNKNIIIIIYLSFLNCD